MTVSRAIDDLPEPTGARDTLPDDQSGHYVSPLRVRPEFLKQVRLFVDLERHELEGLASVCTLQVFTADQTIFRQGDPGDALMIVASGIVELSLRRPGVRPVALGVLKELDYFGELALLDGGARSASAVALTECTIIAIERGALQRFFTAPVLTRLLHAIIARIRSADDRLVDLTDKVARAAGDSAHAAVAVELDTIKTLYHRTELLTNEVMKRADESASTAIDRCEATLEGVREREQRLTALVRFWGGALLALLGIAGVPSIWKAYEMATSLEKAYTDAVKQADEVQSKAQTITRFVSTVETSAQRVQSLERSLKGVKESVSDLQQARELAGLGTVIDTPQELARIAANHEIVKKELMKRYISAAADEGESSHFEATVVLEAVDTYLALARRARDDRQLTLTSEEMSLILRALSYVLENLPDASDRGQDFTATLMSQKLRSDLRAVARKTPPALRATLIDRLQALVATPGNQRTIELAALALADLGVADASAIAVLNRLLKEDPRRRTESAILLAKLKQPSGWRYIAQQVEIGDSTMSLALAQEGLNEVQSIKRQFGDQLDLVQKIEEGLLSHASRNPFEVRYREWLAKCLSKARGTWDEAGGWPCEEI